MSYFNNIEIEIFGSSHSEEIGMNIRGIARGTKIDIEEIQAFVDRRKSGNTPWSTKRFEPDLVEFVEGIKDGVTNGEQIKAIIKNLNQRSQDYEKFKDTPRPSHADFCAIKKDGEKACLAGGGRFSGRMTAPLCIAGAIALSILRQKNIEIGAFISEIGNIKGKSYKDSEINWEQIVQAREDKLTVLELETGSNLETKIGLENTTIGNMDTLSSNYLNSTKTNLVSNTGRISDKMEQAVLSASKKGDSLGGAIECIVYGLPIGLGDSLFDGLEGRIALSVFAIPAVKGVEFGEGFGLCKMTGSKANDAFCIKDGKVGTKTNHSGGINGGISNGMPLTLRVGIKPTPSISKIQSTVNLATFKDTTIEIKGRHDACIVPRAVPVVEAAVALAILDAVLDKK